MEERIFGEINIVIRVKRAEKDVRKRNTKTVRTNRSLEYADRVSKKN
jgi:hypothetical protein